MTGAGNEQRHLCTFYIGEFCFGIEVSQLQEVLKHSGATRVPLAPDMVHGLINLRGQVLITIKMRILLDIHNGDEIKQADPRDSTPRLHMVVRSEDGPVSFMIDRVGDVIEVGPDMFEPVPETVGGIARQLLYGAYKLEDRLVLAFDVAKALQIIREASEEIRGPSSHLS